MNQELTIEQLKFAREIGATNCWNGEYWKSGTQNCASVFMNGEWVDELGRADPSGCFSDLWIDSKIDFAPLDEYEAAQEVPEGYYLDDESGKLKPLKPKAESVRSKYHREIKPGVWVDVYDVINAWKITNPAQQHLAKKALQAGDRGHKGYAEDMRDIIASAGRAIEINEGEAK